jgi:hypothetical protein
MKNNNNLMIACRHLLKGKTIYHQTETTLLCRECFRHYSSYGHDKNGHWEIPKDEDTSNLKTVCRFCVNRITKNK